MLRILFNQKPRVDTGLYRQCLESIEDFCAAIRKRSGRSGEFSVYDRLELAAQAFTRALDELEQSIYCAKKLKEHVVHSTTREMDHSELLDYYRHLYFYKNAFIRIFSILDKLGYFMNVLFQARTEKIKPRFSFFTVLRQLNRLKLEPELTRKLNAYKSEYGEALQRLREKRNLEIHLINVELLDDFHLRQKQSLDHQNIENLSDNLRDLDQGYEMVCRSLLATFDYAIQYVDRKGFEVKEASEWA